MKENLPTAGLSKPPVVNRFSRFTRLLLCLLLFGGTILFYAYLSSEPSAGAAPAAQKSEDGIWSSVDENTVSIAGSLRRTKTARPQHRVRLDKSALERVLRQAPMEFSDAASRSIVVITLPMPDRTFARFRIEESPIMEASLAAQFPEIKTYQGQGIDDPTATTRFDLTPRGFHAIVLSPSDTIYVDPTGSEGEYVTFNKRDFHRAGETFHCYVGESKTGLAPERQQTEPVPNVVTNAGTLHTYRLAVAATGEYTAFQGNTVALALAAINTTMNRVNGIYERDLSIRMVLIANETNI